MSISAVTVLCHDTRIFYFSFQLFHFARNPYFATLLQKRMHARARTHTFALNRLTIPEPIISINGYVKIWILPFCQLDAKVRRIIRMAIYPIILNFRDDAESQGPGGVVQTLALVPFSTK